MVFTIIEILIILIFKLYCYADSYAQGLRRLTKSYVVEDVESSSQIESLDDKNGKKKNNADQSEIPVTLRENETREVLQAIPVFQPNLREVQSK